MLTTEPEDVWWYWLWCSGVELHSSTPINQFLPLHNELSSQHRTSIRNTASSLQHKRSSANRCPYQSHSQPTHQHHLVRVYSILVIWSEIQYRGEDLMLRWGWVPSGSFVVEVKHVRRLGGMLWRLHSEGDGEEMVWWR